MASSRKKASSGRKSAAKKKKSAGGRERGGVQFPWRSELVVFAALAVSILIFISNLGKGGAAGHYISIFFFGMFGILSYAFPFLLFFVTAFLVSNLGKGDESYRGRTLLKVISSLALYVFLSVFCFLLFQREFKGGPLMAYLESARIRGGGGLVGAVIGNALHKSFGLAGAYVIVLIILVLSVVLLREKSMFRGISRKSREAYIAARENIRRSREEESEMPGEDVSAPGAGSADAERRRTRTAERSKRRAEEESEVTAKDEDGMAEGMYEIDTEPYAAEEEEADAAAGESVADVRKRKASAAKPKSSFSDAEEITPPAAKDTGGYAMPPRSLLREISKNQTGDSKAHQKEMKQKLQNTLDDFGVKARVTNVTAGPTVTQYEIQPEAGVKVSKILSLADDIRLNLAAQDIRFEAPIPGKSAIGLEVPNKENITITLRELIECREFERQPSKICFCAGKDIAGRLIVADIAKMPHLLIAGATGSGKSVCINTIIMSILFRATPDDVRMIMIDPKVVELSVYNGIPHLLIPVVTDPKKAAGALTWAVSEMMERYRIFRQYGVRDIEGYRQKVKKGGDGQPMDPMPQIVIVVDELADLMMVASSEVEDAICRIAQLARAAGMHLVIATQRPSVNVITGLIKANMPSRIAFAVSSGVDSRTILDMNGAEKLLGKGDMLFYPQSYPKPLRVQGAFVSEKEVSDVVNYIIKNSDWCSYSEEVEDQVKKVVSQPGTKSSDDERDAYFAEAGRLLIEKERGSIGMLQRAFKIGFNRAARVMGQLQEAGVVGPEEGTKPRRVLMSPEQFETYLESEEREE